MERMEQLKAMLSLCLIFGMAFCLGSVVGHTVRVRDQAVMARPAQKDWGLSFQEDNKPPVADENMEQLAQYDAFYAENTTEKVLYLTFDCGYENGNTPAILDALKKHHVPAAFFIVGHTVSVRDQAVMARPAQKDWGLSFQEDNKPPVADENMEQLAQYDAFYAENTTEKVLYLTFDCGYENGNTPAILDALKKHHVPAAFFIVGNYLEKNPDLVKRMRAEGHIIGNHSYHHPDMSQMGKEEFQKELAQLEDLYEQTTGEKMSKFYRPPQGKYSDNNLQLAKELGYRTIFWSLAYVDWKQEEQPTHEEAMSKLLKRVHPGAIVLLHNTSRTNGEILDEVLTKWEEMGYHFASLEELVSSGSREARSFFLTDNQENPVKSAAPTHAAGSQKQARGKLTSFMAISAVIMRANSSTTPPIIGRKL